VPPLRERGGDITLLAGYFCELVRRKLGLQQITLDIKALQCLMSYDWPGNVRELDHVISRASLSAKSHSSSAIVKIKEKHLEYLTNTHPSTISDPINDVLSSTAPVVASLKQATEQFQRKVIISALEKERGNWAAAARHLQLDRANLNRMAKRLGISLNKVIDVNA